MTTDRPPEAPGHRDEASPLAPSTGAPSTGAPSTGAPSTGAPAETVTDDIFLGGHLNILQPRTGFRAGLDSVILASCLEARRGERLFEPGMGVGTATLCAAWRLRDARFVGVEIDQDMAALAQENVIRNGLEERITAVEGDVAALPQPLLAETFDQVFFNPPYAAPEEGNRARDPARARALAGDLDGPDFATWVDLAIRRLKPRGTLSLIHRAEKLDGILGLLWGRVGAVTVVPLWPMAGRSAKRVLVRGRRQIQGGLTLHPGLVLHEADGTPTPELEAIAREGAGLWDVLSRPSAQTRQPA